MDKDKIHIDKDFLDQSWANMSQILDKEMPVKKKKRRFVWLFVSSLMALTFVVIAYSTSSSSKEINALPIDNKTQSVIENKKTKVAVNQSINLKKEERSNTQISMNTKSTDQSIATKTVKKLKLTSSSKPTQSSLDSEDIFMLSGKGHSLSDSPSTYQVEDVKSSLTDSPNKDLIKIEKTTKNNLENLGIHRLLIADFAPIPTLNFKPLYIDNSSILFTTFPVKKRARLHYGVYAGKTYPKFGSFRAGVHVQKEINSKWAVYMGLGYAKRILNDRFINQNENTDVAINQLPEVDMMGSASTSPAPSADQMGSQNSSTNSLSFQNFHYFELPILLQYQLNHRWSFEVGGQISRLYGLTYQSAGDNASFSSDLSFINTRAEEFLSSSLSLSDQSSSGTKITSWDVAALGGAAFKITPKFQVYSQYKYGLNKPISVPNDADYHKKWRQIELGVRYYFK